MTTEHNSRLTIDVWSDVMCPFCYLGDAALDKALSQFAHSASVDIRYHSFLLMPELSRETPVDLTELLTQKRGFPADQVKTMNDRIAEQGQPFGLDYRFDLAVTINTRSAHELSHFAAEHGKQHEMMQRLFRAYFTEGRNVADHATLVELATEIGLDGGKAAAALESGQFAEAVDSDIARARQLNISGVPFFVFADKYAVSGAQSVDTFLQALETSWADSVTRENE